ncbi:MAG TPA: hypothetical protein VJ805_05615 [Nitrospiraceae bacterium]|nr:hypothetical protein [Nitrospiraceae bacterium]
MIHRLRSSLSQHGLLIAGLLVIVWGSGAPASGEDRTLKSPTWSGLRGQPGLSALDPASSMDPNRTVFRQAPALTGRFELNDQTFFPFIGAGFGGGYTNDRDRALGSNGLFHNPTQSGDLGKNMMPNEFNLGLRIPF